MDDWSVYLLRCADQSLYCGVTKDIEKRLLQHSSGTASKYTRSRLPVTLESLRNGLSKSQAYQLEYRVKKTPKAKKISVLQTWEFENQTMSSGCVPGAEASIPEKE